MHPSTAPHDPATPHLKLTPPAASGRRIFVACLAFGLATAASVFAGAIALAQTSEATEVVVIRTMYAGHGDATCPGIAEVAADVGDPVTYCYELTNPSASPLDRVEFVDASTGADTAHMPIVDGIVPVPANGTVTWAFATRATVALAGPAPTPTTEPTATPQPTVRPTPSPTPTLAIATPTAAPDPTAMPADPTAIPADPTATPGPTAVPADPTAIPADPTATPDPTAVPADPTAIPADPTAVPAVASAPAPPAPGAASVRGPSPAVRSGSAVDGSSVASASTTVSSTTATVSAESTAVPRSNRTTLVPIATSSGWRLGNTTVAMVLSVLIAVVAGLVAGVVFWRFARHLQHRRSALYWYERLAVMEA